MTRLWHEKWLESKRSLFLTSRKPSLSSLGLVTSNPSFGSCKFPPLPPSLSTPQPATNINSDVPLYFRRNFRVLFLCRSIAAKTGWLHYQYFSKDTGSYRSHLLYTADACA